mmetsp:Transcript_9966/g.23950  ORF Transcript_9966/g.23950 Transcript_9966/m.23950 type:complete len:261 (-) Transcript_9966:1083-1865(-)
MPWFRFTCFPQLAVASQPSITTSQDCLQGNAMQRDDIELRSQVAPTGVLRAGINLANFLLVSGKTLDGAPAGVSPGVAAEIAKRLGIELCLIPFPNPKDVGDAVVAGSCDIAMIGAEPQREEKISFSKPYAEIPATYLVPQGSPWTRVEDVDSPGVQIACMAGTAFGLWLEKNIKHASLVKAASMDEALECLINGKATVLANLKQRLLSDVQKIPGGRILEGDFMTVKQDSGSLRNVEGSTVHLHHLRVLKIAPVCSTCW